MFRYLKTVCRYLITLLYSILFKLPRFAKNPDKYEFNDRFYYLQRLIQKVSKGLKAEFIVSGQENIPEGTICLLANHSSAFDPLALVSTLDKPFTFICKKEVTKSKIITNCVKTISGEFMDRDDLKQSLRIMMKVESQLKNNERSWVIFPEGTRLKDPLLNLNAFHPGTFRAPMRAGVPIVPVALYGCERVFKTKNKFKRYPIHISFLKPLYKEDYESLKTDEVAKIVSSRIEKEINFSLRKKDLDIMKENKKYRYNQTN